MKVILDIKDEKADFLMELLNGLSYVKVKPVEKQSSYKKEVLDGLKKAVEEVNEARRKKKKLKTLDQFLDEL